MRIWSSGGAGFWHPLSSAIRFARPAMAADMAVPLIPGLFEEGWDDPDTGRLIRSTQLHELAHKDAARATRFGFILAAAAGTAAVAWEAGAPIVSCPTWLDQACGAMLPFLEGMATFVQLDLDVDQNEPLLPNTVTPRIQEYCVFQASGWQRLIDYFRLMEVFEEDRIDSDVSSVKKDGLLRRLFMDGSDSGKTFYSAGYLWVKAASVLVARACPEVARPALLYPIINKLLFDHPIFTRIAASEAAPSAREMISEISATLFSSDLRRLSAILPMTRPYHSPSFDHIDLHGLLATGEVRERDDTEIIRVTARLSEGEQAKALTFREAAHCHIEPYVAGCVLNFRFENGDIAITMADRDGGVAEHRLSAPDDHIDFWNQSLSSRLQLPAEEIEAAGEKLSAALVHVLRTAKEHEMTIEIGSYLRLDWTADHGFVIWPEKPINGISVVPIPWTPIGHSDHVLGQLFRGLSLSPSRREAFEAAVPATQVLKEAAREATDAVIEALISDPMKRSFFRSARLSPLVGRSARRELRNWALVPLFLGKRWLVPASALTELDVAIDFPGFPIPTAGHRVRIGDVLPVVNPPATIA